MKGSALSETRTSVSNLTLIATRDGLLVCEESTNLRQLLVLDTDRNRYPSRGLTGHMGDWLGLLLLIEYERVSRTLERIGRF